MHGFFIAKVRMQPFIVTLCGLLFYRGVARFIATALLQVLQNLVNLLGIPSSLNFAVMGAVIFLGVLVDQVSGQRKKKQQVPAPAPLAAQPTT